ncbi:MAG: phosphoglucomutase/phosphomannomutase family protein, partial [Syntrophomonadaceae bacterium]|nr:phosphoglucomutase/phosphomannomutase family protein [Syntrophomonadaceae bacterium]
PPEPTERRLEDLRRSVRTYEAALGLALDGDADRFGVVDERGEFFPANRLLPMLLEHLLQTRSFRGPVARTVATTHMLDRVARHYGLGVVETPVGFKYVSQCLRERGCILGGEESGGLSIFGHVPYRDGVLAGLLTAEMVGRAGKPLSALFADFAAVHGRVEYERLDLPLSERDCERVRAHLQEYTPKAIAGVKVEDTVLLDGRKFLLEDGSWVLVRPAGTEQLLRLYVEAHDRVRLADIQKEVQLSLGLLAQ